MTVTPPQPARADYAKGQIIEYTSFGQGGYSVGRVARYAGPDEQGGRPADPFVYVQPTSGGQPLRLRPRFTAHFVPGGPAGETAAGAGPEGQQDWDCTEFARRHPGYVRHLAETGSLTGGVADTDDVFRADPAAPDGVRGWRGPFTLTVRQQDGPAPLWTCPGCLADFWARDSPGRADRHVRECGYVDDSGNPVDLVVKWSVTHWYIASVPAPDLAAAAGGLPLAELTGRILDPDWEDPDAGLPDFLESLTDAPGCRPEADGWEIGAIDAPRPAGTAMRAREFTAAAAANWLDAWLDSPGTGPGSPDVPSGELPDGRRWWYYDVDGALGDAPLEPGQAREDAPMPLTGMDLFVIEPDGSPAAFQSNLTPAQALEAVRQAAAGNWTAFTPGTAGNQAVPPCAEAPPLHWSRTPDGTPAFDQATRAYLRAVANAGPAALPYRTVTCPECGSQPQGSGLVAGPGGESEHVLAGGAVVIGCEGYWVVSPDALGLPRGAWQDWRDSSTSDAH